MLNQNKYQHQTELMRIAIAGSVDDGKSTLLGRILLDTNVLQDDVLQSVAQSSAAKGVHALDLSMFTDGLKEEREKGITIDVAYRYFQTEKRKFIIADTPGHIEFTRNMITGASTANAVIVMIDATKGVSEQTNRHSYLASLLQIPHLVVCVNKMDAVEFSEEVFNRIVSNFNGFVSKLDIQDITIIPTSGLNGDNIVHRLQNMPWYAGATLLHVLENMHVGSDFNHIDARLPIQFQLNKTKEITGFAGQIAGGVFRNNDEVMLYPQNRKSRIRQIWNAGVKVENAFAPMSVLVNLADVAELEHVTMICKPNNQPKIQNEIEAMFCWMDEEKLNLNTKYVVKHTSTFVKGSFQNILYQYDINQLNKVFEVKSIGLNDIFRATIKVDESLFVDAYRRNRITGSIIIIDNVTNNTVAAGMII